MRFTILLTLCVLGVASAGSLNKRGLAEDLQSQSQNALKAFQDFSEQAKHNAEETLNKFMDFFKQFSKKPEAEATEEKTVEKRDLAENIQKLTGHAKENFEKNLKAIQDFFAQFNKHAEAPVEPESAESDPQTVAKRDIQEQIQNFLKDAQAKANDVGGNFLRDARAKLLQAVQQFLKDAQTKAANVGSEVQKAIDNLFAVAEKKVEESQNVVKRDVREDIQNFLKDAQTKAKDAGESFLKDARVKVMSALQKFLADAQSKAANVGSEVQKAIDSFFAKAEAKIGGSAEAQEVVKRDVKDTFRSFFRDAKNKVKGAGKEFLGDVKEKAEEAALDLIKNLGNSDKLQKLLSDVMVSAFSGKN